MRNAAAAAGHPPSTLNLRYLAVTPVSRRSAAWSSTWIGCRLIRRVWRACTGSPTPPGRTDRNRRAGELFCHSRAPFRSANGATCGNARTRPCAPKQIRAARMPADSTFCRAIARAAFLNPAAKSGNFSTPRHCPCYLMCHPSFHAEFRPLVEHDRPRPMGALSATCPP